MGCCESRAAAGAATTTNSDNIVGMATLGAVVAGGGGGGEAQAAERPLGVSVPFLRWFLEHWASRTPSAVTTTDVCEALIKPTTSQKRCAFVGQEKQKMKW